MGANEIANRVEASAWVAAAGQIDEEGTGGPISAADFFFRSLSGFVNRIEVLGVDPAVDTWDTLTELVVALFLDRNYARKDTTMLLQPIDSARPQSDDPAIVLPSSYQGPLRVLPLSAEGYITATTGAPPLTLPGSLDPYSVLLVVADLDAFQLVGKGLEFGIEVLRMPDYDGPPASVNFLTAGP